MKIRLFILTLIFLFAILPLFARQAANPDSKIRPGIYGGVNLQNIYGKKYDGDRLENDLIFGYHAGVIVTIPLAADIYLQPGLALSAKGSKQEILENTFRITNLSYLEVPLNLLYRPQLGNGHILLGAGPYFAVGVFGNQKDKSDGDEIGDLKVKFKNSTDTDYAYYKPLDIGGNILFGYEFYSGIFVQLNAQLGLYKINPDFDISDDKTSKKNIGFGLSFGYRF